MYGTERKRQSTNVFAIHLERSNFACQSKVHYDEDRQQHNYHRLRDTADNQHLSSAQNLKIKELPALQEKSKLRQSEKLFVVECRRELGHCLDAGSVPKTLFICGELLTEEELDGHLGKAERLNPKVGVVQIPYELYGKIAYRGGTEGVIAEVEFKERTLESLKLSRNPLVIMLESVEKPGNLGTILLFEALRQRQ